MAKTNTAPLNSPVSQITIFHIHTYTHTHTHKQAISNKCPCTGFRVEATPAGTSGYNVFLENVLLLVVVGSLVSSSVMLLTCMMCVCIHTFKRKKAGKNGELKQGREFYFTARQIYILLVL